MPSTPSKDRTAPTPRRRRDGRGRWVIASSVIIGLLAAPFAIAAGEGSPLLGGKRNPGSNESATLGAETEIIAANGTYGTRQSNKTNGDGGGAIYGCRSVPGKEPCVRANNLNTGRAFEFATNGKEGGFIELADTTGAPLTTNATGVATNFNADKVDGRDAGDLVAKSELLFAVVSATGTLGAKRGAASASAIGTNYTVAFDRDVSACAWTATPQGPTPGPALSVEQGADAKSVVVHASTATAFHLTAVC